MSDFTTELLENYTIESVWAYLTDITPLVVAMILFSIGYVVVATAIKVRKGRFG